ncbi:hypothetical protein BJF83_20720 [Nocardiopsis sp. CNR-923]|uniref:hypothetical protein n=1 Tax=Nocardiopsis sp. CNR-923 TaxID=1904965 RepID=UPI00095FD78F|nr:hypothetical protein [Nocardiopsis sp. CNR-923]OLT26589.1 hypothetical protein BJF83_20720 [Nocardiopsis sp. CNR-923]
MPTDRKKKAAARALAARTGWSYTAALRRLDSPDRPFDMMTVGGGPCPPGCNENRHLGLACWTWRPEDAKGSSWQVRQWADLPSGRAERVTQQAHEMRHGDDPRRSTYDSPWRDRWLLALIYAMLTDQRPELVPDPGALRTAVEADDLAAVDAVMDPLDRAAAHLTTRDPEQWRADVRPRLDAYADWVEADDAIPYTWIESERGTRRWKLVEKWRQAWETYVNLDGYRQVRGAPWAAPKRDLDTVLTARHGGHAPGTQVRLDDGSPARVYAAEWEQDGPPGAYWVRDLVPNEYRPGQLKTAMGPGRCVDAAECLADPPGTGEH